VVAEIEEARPGMLSIALPNLAFMRLVITVDYENFLRQFEQHLRISEGYNPHYIEDR
jgi:hypothetical protein